jgi:hypothetical protein
MCQQQDLTNAIQKVEPIKVIKEVISIDSTEYMISITKPYFQSEDGRCNKLNQLINGYVDSLQLSIKERSNEFFNVLYDTIETPQPFGLMISDSIFIISNKYISFLLYIETYISGEPHGFNYSLSFNYDLENQRLLTNQEIIDYSRKEDVDKLLQKYFHNHDNCFSIMPTLNDNYTLNFNTEEFTFTYRPYILGSYACWYAQIVIPRDEIEKFIMKKGLMDIFNGFTLSFPLWLLSLQQMKGYE